MGRQSRTSLHGDGGVLIGDKKDDLGMNINIDIVILGIE